MMETQDLVYLQQRQEYYGLQIEINRKDIEIIKIIRSSLIFATDIDKQIFDMVSSQLEVFEARQLYLEQSYEMLKMKLMGEYAFSYTKFEKVDVKSFLGNN